MRVLLFCCAHFVLAFLFKIVENQLHKKFDWVDTEKGQGWITRMLTLFF